MQLRKPLLRSPFLVAPALVLAVNLLCGFGLFHHKKYETPITKDTMQPDKVLFDRAIKYIEKGQYLSARLTLQTLINTYDTSEYLAKAKLAIADSWFREGDAHGLAQAEIEYKDFILFYPNMEEAAESQSKICDIHMKQLSKPDRDNSEAQRAEDECRQVIVQFPNSKYRAGAEQNVRDVQEVLADKEYQTGLFYWKKGALPAAQGRFAYLTQQYPNYSQADEALWDLADSYRKMGDRFENQEADALTKIVRDYPVSLHAEAAKNMLAEMKRPVPQGDPAAYAREKYNLEHRTREGFLSRVDGVISGHPDMGYAAKQGDPVMTAVRPGNPVSIPMEAASSLNPSSTGGGATGVSDVGIGVAGNTTALDQKSDARINPQQDEHKASVTSNGISTDSAQAAAQAQQAVPLPTNRTKKDIDAFMKQQQAAAKAQEKAAAEAAKKAASKKKSTNAPASTVAPTPATSTTPQPAPTPAAAQQ